MSCILRVYGGELNIDECLKVINLIPDNQYRKGEPVAGANPKNRKYKSSGFSLRASRRGEVKDQIKDSFVFLQSNQAALKKLSRKSDVEGIDLDFAWYFPVGEHGYCAQYHNFPANLLRLCGELNINIEVSVYIVEAESKEDENLIKRNKKRKR